MIRKVDELGRIVLPTEYRRALHIQEKEELEMTLEPDRIILKKPVLGCLFCEAGINLVRIGAMAVCRSCIDRLHEAKDGDFLYQTKVD